MDFRDSKTWARVATVALAVVGFALLLTALRWRTAFSPAPRPTTAPLSPHVSEEARTNPPAATADSATRMLASRASLQAAQNPATVRGILTELDKFLSDLPATGASAVIRTFLESKADAATGLGFKIGPQGRLTEAPSLRVWLLDYLTRVDRAAAADYAKGVLSSKDSPDEWAVALRNVAQVDQSAEGKIFLDHKMNELFRNEAWQADPSEGYLEAFDVAVHLGGTNLVAPLAKLLGKPDNKAVAHAAFLALDRLAIKDTAEVLALLLAEPNLMAGRELTRANYFARSTVSDPRQREAIELYLLETWLSPAELSRFVSLFPNASYLLSQNLLTRTEVPDQAVLARRDRAALGVVEGWLKEPRFEGLRPQLESIHARLQEFVRWADHGR